MSNLELLRRALIAGSGVAAIGVATGAGANPAPIAARLSLNENAFGPSPKDRSLRDR